MCEGRPGQPGPAILGENLGSQREGCGKKCCDFRDGKTKKRAIQQGLRKTGRGGHGTNSPRNMGCGEPRTGGGDIHNKKKPKTTPGSAFPSLVK